MLTESPYAPGGGVNVAPISTMVGHDARDPGFLAPRAEPKPAPSPGPYPDDWRQDAACARVDPELFFPECADGYRERTNAALRICREVCPVRARCLAESLLAREHGIWGGMTDKERHALTPAQRRRYIAAAGAQERKPV